MQPATCDDIAPISAPGQKFQCAEETTQYDPNQNKATPPTEKECCKVRKVEAGYAVPSVCIHTYCYAQVAEAAVTGQKRIFTLKPGEEPCMPG
jgi:hypothetical protein